MITRHAGSPATRVAPAAPLSGEERLGDATRDLTTLSFPLTQDPEALRFRQLPTFEDCFPASEKHYREVEHNGTLLRVSARHLLLAHFMVAVGW